MNTQIKLLSAALTLALFAAAPASAQDTGTDTETETATSQGNSVPQDRLVDRYADAAGSEAAAEGLVTSLRNGDDLTVTQTTTTTTNADGTTTTTTSTADVVIENPNGPMGWGEVDKALGIAQELVDGEKFASLEDALTGTADITNADGTVTAGTDGILQLRADGMGWGQIAKEYDFKLGSVIGNRKTSTTDSDDGTTAAKVRGASERDAKPQRAAKAERAAKPERVAKVERPQRPERVERPAKPERPERPQKPERSGRL